MPTRPIEEEIATLVERLLCRWECLRRNYRYQKDYREFADVWGPRLMEFGRDLRCMQGGELNMCAYEPCIFEAGLDAWLDAFATKWDIMWPIAPDRDFPEFRNPTIVELIEYCCRIPLVDRRTSLEDSKLKRGTDLNNFVARYKKRVVQKITPDIAEFLERPSPAFKLGIDSPMPDSATGAALGLKMGDLVIWEQIGQLLTVKRVELPSPRFLTENRVLNFLIPELQDRTARQLVFMKCGVRLKSWFGTTLAGKVVDRLPNSPTARPRFEGSKAIDSYLAVWEQRRRKTQTLTTLAKKLEPKQYKQYSQDGWAGPNAAVAKITYRYHRADELITYGADF